MGFDRMLPAYSDAASPVEPVHLTGLLLHQVHSICANRPLKVPFILIAQEVLVILFSSARSELNACR
jgi:hypothetical protein